MNKCTAKQIQKLNQTKQKIFTKILNEMTFGSPQNASNRPAGCNNARFVARCVADKPKRRQSREAAATGGSCVGMKGID